MTFLNSKLTPKALQDLPKNVSRIMKILHSAVADPFFACSLQIFKMLKRCEHLHVVHLRNKTRGDVSYEFFSQSGDMFNLAYIGAKNLNF